MLWISRNKQAVALVGAFWLVSCQAGATRTREGKYNVKHELDVDVPEGAQQARVWFALPQNDPAQQVNNLKVEAPLPTRFVTDSEGNQTLFLEAKSPLPAKIHVSTTFQLTRFELHSIARPEATRPLNETEVKAHEKELQANTNVIIDDRIRAKAAEILKGETNPVRGARLIYDWVLNNIDYWVKDPANKKASPVGSSEYCLTSRTGNCTDFHSLWASLARASGIPTKLVYGSLLKKELNGKDEDQSYHCWIEFFAPSLGWIPLDVAVADIYADPIALSPANETLVKRTTCDGYDGQDLKKVDYYFGNLDERRVTWSLGRDLQLEPRQTGGPLNALPKAYVEVDGQPLAEKTGWRRKLTYTEVP